MKKVLLSLVAVLGLLCFVGCGGGGGDGDSAPDTMDDITGTWIFTYFTGAQRTVDLIQNGDALGGTYHWSNGDDQDFK